MSEQYILNGRVPVAEPDLMKWAAWYGTAERRIADEEVGPARVSTVFLGLDHQFGKGTPLLFETMVFWATNDAMHNECDRFSTWEEAEAGHAAMLDRVKAALAGLSENQERA